MSAKVLVPLGLGTALSLMGDATLYTVLPTHTAEAGITLASVGLLLGINRAVRLVLNGLAGAAYDRWPRRWLFVPSLVIGALSTVLYAATRGFWPLLAGRVLWGLAWSGIWVGGATVILDVTTTRDRGRMTGLYNTWFFGGAAVGALAGGVLTDRLGYSTAMWAGAGLTFAGAIAAWLFLPETRSRRPQPAHAVAAEPGSGWLRSPALWAAASVQAVNRFATAGIISATLGLLVQDRMGSAGRLMGVATITGLLMAGRTSLSILSAPAAGAISDRLGNRWQVAGWMLLAGAAGMALMAQVGPAAILAGVGLGAVSSGGVQVIATTVTGDLVGDAQRGRAIGLLNTAGDLGSAVGPPVAYALLPWVGLAGVYWLSAALFISQWLLVLGRHRLRAAGRNAHA